MQQQDAKEKVTQIAAQDAEKVAEQATRLMGEAPSISTAVHNFFAALLAEEFADAQSLHALSRTLLKTISAHDMLETPQWGLRNPQGDMPALARIEQLAEHKVVHAVWKVARTKFTVDSSAHCEAGS